MTRHRFGPGAEIPGPSALLGTASHVAIPIDHVADAALVSRDLEATEAVCDVCEAPVGDEPGGRGLLLWHRGDDVREEEPVLCDDCATAITTRALGRIEEDDDEG
jgi:hypothetical protein